MPSSAALGSSHASLTTFWKARQSSVKWLLSNRSQQLEVTLVTKYHHHTFLLMPERQQPRHRPGMRSRVSGDYTVTSVPNTAPTPLCSTGDAPLMIRATLQSRSSTVKCVFCCPHMQRCALMCFCVTVGYLLPWTLARFSCFFPL